MDSSPPGSSVHGILLARILNYHSLLQGIFLTQGSNWCFLCLLHWQVSSLPLEPLGNPFLHCRQILYCLSHQGSPYICVYTHTHTHTDVFSSPMLRTRRECYPEICLLNWFSLGLWKHRYAPELNSSMLRKSSSANYWDLTLVVIRTVLFLL